MKSRLRECVEAIFLIGFRLHVNGDVVHSRVRDRKEDGLVEGGVNRPYSYHERPGITVDDRTWTEREGQVGA